MAMNCRERAWEFVRTIPQGLVVTYGEVSGYVGGNPQHVGSAMRTAESKGLDVPWQRVVRASGFLSKHAPPHQRELLEKEGVSFLAGNRVDLRRHKWRP